MKQKTRTRFKDARNTVVTTADAVIAAEDRAGAAVLHKTRDEEIELRVVIVVEPRRTSGPVWRGDSGFVGYVGKRAVAVVVEENIATVVGYVKILPTIAVKIRRCRAHPKLPIFPQATPAFSVTSVNVPSPLLR